HPNELRVDNGILFCVYCDHSIEWNCKSTVDNYCNSKAHLANKKSYENKVQTMHQQTLEASISAKKVDRLLPFFKKYLRERVSIFTNKPVAILMHETTDDCSRSV
ncbi:18933_t:CDS:2, partial [Gigaspora rosea]